MTTPLPSTSASKPGNDTHGTKRRNAKPGLAIVLPPQRTSPTGDHASAGHPLTSLMTHRLSLRSPRSRHTEPPASPGPNEATTFLPDASASHQQRTAGAQSFLPDQPDFAAIPVPTKIDQNTAFWKAYNDAGDLEDKEFVKTSGGDLDVLLIFAGLFSATNTSFIIESYKNLRADQAEETNKLLHSLLSLAQNPQASVHTEPFVVSVRDVRINACFFTSLCCSLTAAFGAVLAKQWLTQYDRDGGGLLKTPSARGQERQRKYEGRDKWHLEDVIVTLPTLLQFSLFFFFVGLIDLLWPLNNIVMGITLGFTLATFVFYITTIAISVYDDSAPFQTRLSPLIRSPLHRIWDLARRVTSKSVAGIRELHAKVNQDANVSCVSYLLERVTKEDDLKVVADAFVSIADDPGVAKITDSFIDFHLKPTTGKGVKWSIPSLCGPTGSSLLKILNILVREWKKSGNALIKTTLYHIDRTLLFCDIPGELRTAFLANPADTQSCYCIINILLTLNPSHPQSTSEHLSKDMVPWQSAWLEEDVTKNLENKDPDAQMNTLRVLNLVTQGCAERTSAWEIVRKARVKNPMLKKIIHTTVWREISNFGCEGASDGANVPYLLEWLAMSEDMDGLADALDALPDGSETTFTAAQPLISTVVAIVVKSHLSPTFDGWWRLPGLHDQNRRSLLRILHVVVVRWRYLESSLAPGPGPLPPLNSPSMVSSLRAELWKAFLAEPEDSGALHMITDICKNLPTPVQCLSDDNEVNITAMREVGTDMLAMLLNNDQADPTVLKHCFSLLCSNADSLIMFANFHAIRLTPGRSRAIPDHLLSSFRYPATLKDFWRSAFCMQVLPVFFPDKLQSLKFAKSLHVWFKQFAKHDTETPVDKQGADRPTGHDGIRQKRLYWTYLLSLQRVLANAEFPEPSKELKENGHQLHLLEILDDVNCQSYSTCAPLALYLFLRLWSEDMSDVTVEGVKGITNALASGNLSLGLISLDIRIHAEATRVGDVPYGEWSDEISDQLARYMGEMMKWLYQYLEAAIQRGLVDVKGLDDALNKYSSWCSGMDGTQESGEYCQLCEGLRGAGRRFRDSQPALAPP